MGQQSDQGDWGPGEERRAPVAAVRPRMRGRSVPVFPRTLVAAVVVGLVAFVAGAQLGPPRQDSPTTVVAPSTSDRVPPTPIAVPSVVAGESPFANTFYPGLVLDEAGLVCTSSGLSGGAGAGRAFFVESERCAVPTARQGPLILALEGVISGAIRRTAITRGEGFSVASGPEVPRVTSWDYRSDGFDGSLTLVATSAGPVLELVFILMEQVTT